MGKRSTQRELDLALDAQCQQWWNYGKQVARAQASGIPVPETAAPVFGPVLRPQEQFRMAGDASYARFYAAGDGSWSVPGSVVIGNAAFMTGALIGGAVARSRAKAQAADAAHVRWREQQSASVIVTDQRVLCHVSPRGWLSFWFGGVTEYHPNPSQWSVVFGFEDTSPLALSGPAAAGIIAWSAPKILSSRWTTDPRMAPLLVP